MIILALALVAAQALTPQDQATVDGFVQRMHDMRTDPRFTCTYRNGWSVCVPKEEEPPRKHRRRSRR